MCPRRELREAREQKNRDWPSCRKEQSFTDGNLLGWELSWASHLLLRGSVQHRVWHVMSVHKPQRESLERCEGSKSNIAWLEAVQRRQSRLKSIFPEASVAKGTLE